MSDSNANRWDWKALCAAILLTCYLGFAIWALFSPSDDPQRGMAIGFIISVALILITLGLLLWRAVARGRRWLVWTIFVIAVIPALLQMSEMIYVTFFRTPG
jgi:heme/copper-type cytochrome/quinol oxidase subunit 4